MNCRNCIYCVQEKRYQASIVCQNKQLIEKRGLDKEYALVDEPNYCIFYTTLKQYAKEQAKKNNL